MEVELGSKVTKELVGLEKLPDSKQLQELGFEWLSRFADAKRRLAIAYEHYKRISEDSWSHVYAYCKQVKISNWCGEVPPLHVLNALKEAKTRGCFESFWIYTYKSDPMLIGIVSFGIDGRESLTFERPFVIGHWGDDIAPEWLEQNTD